MPLSWSGRWVRPRLRGYAVDEPVLAEMTRWVAESGDGKFGLTRPASAPNALSPKAVWFALALEANPRRDASSQKGLKLLLKTVKSEQTENGSWSAWPETRPPIFGRSDESMTALATLAMLPAADAGDDSAKAIRDKGIRWLAETKTDDDPQSIAMRLVLWRRLGRPIEEWEPLVQRIKKRQNTDGGWSQSKDMASDAWATGQALYALAHAGIPPDEPVIARAQAFLTRTQRDDGSWPMMSRPAKPGGDGCKSLIPITHLKILSIFHFVGAGLALLGILFLLAHFAMFHFIFSNPEVLAGPKAGPSTGGVFRDVQVVLFGFRHVVSGFSGFECDFGFVPPRQEASDLFTRGRRHQLPAHPRGDRSGRVYDHRSHP